MEGAREESAFCWLSIKGMIYLMGGVMASKVGKAEKRIEIGASPGAFRL